MTTLPEYVKKALEALRKGGYSSYIVGGCVRDLLMGVTPHDYDITTSALPFQTKECLSCYTVAETGIAHGTVTAIIDGHPLEITTFRIDGAYTDNRHPESVAFTGSLEEDLSRRDFTVNAIASDGNTFIDIFGGADDIKSKRIVCVGSADKRFEEDGLRILRALRFASVLDFDIDAETSASIHKNKNLLLNISAERIYSEFVKLLCGKNALRVLTEYSDVISVFIPEIIPCVGFEQHSKYHCYDVYTHIIMSLSYAPQNAYLRLALYFHDIGKPHCFTVDENGNGHFRGHYIISRDIAHAVLTRLRADKHTLDIVCGLVYDHDRVIIPEVKYVRRLLAQKGYEKARLLMEVKKCDIKAHSPDHLERMTEVAEISRLIDKIEAEKSCISLKTLALNGHDLINAGYAPGKQIGIMLKKALDAVIDGDVPNEKSALLKALTHD